MVRSAPLSAAPGRRGRTRATTSPGGFHHRPNRIDLQYPARLEVGWFRAAAGRRRGGCVRRAAGQAGREPRSDDAAEPVPEPAGERAERQGGAGSLRAGRSIGEVAADAGVDADWVARFAVPVLAEQAEDGAHGPGVDLLEATAGAVGHPDRRVGLPEPVRQGRERHRGGARRRLVGPPARRRYVAGAVLVPVPGA